MRVYCTLMMVKCL